MANKKKFFLLVALLPVSYFLLYNTANNKNIRIGFMGDTMIGRTVNELLASKPTHYIWGDMLNNLLATDLNIANLETTLTTHDKAVPKVFNFKSDPKNVTALTAANITLVSLANNHSLDFGVEGLQETIKTLDSANIMHVGAGKNLDAAMKGAIIEKNGIKIGVLGFTDNEPTWAAGPNKPGINYVHVGNIAPIKQAIALIRNDVDLLILSIHWGPNMRQRPTQEFIDFAHQMIDAGIDIIHGHSAHIFQGIEIYKNKLIMYDTGDFIDDYAIDPLLRNDQSFLFLVDVTKGGIKKLTLIPVLIDTMQVNRATGTVAEEIMRKMQELSAEFGSQLQRENDALIVEV
jgi:poly-gamma-glutamate synthesis protein (capsule biosynthesis protein)